MIRTIFFDFDGVLTLDKSGSYTTCQYLHSVLPTIPFEQILACYRQRHRELLVGKCDHQTIWEEFCMCLGVTLDIAVLDRAFRATPPNSALLQICAHLKQRYRLGIITDNSTERFAAVKDELQLASLFDLFIVSGETGARKEDAANFVTALQRAQAQAAECVFIDNDPSNLIAPASLGIHTIFHDDAQNDLAQLAHNLASVGVDEQRLDVDAH